MSVEFAYRNGQIQERVSKKFPASCKNVTVITDIKEKRNEKADSIYSNPDNDPRGVWTSVSYVNPATKDQRPNLAYPLYNPFTGTIVEHPTNAWKYLIILTSPVMLVTAIGVKLSSPGPVIFRQERIGLNKKPFMMYKFRSMRVNVQQETGWSTDCDPRKTHFGSFIRKFSLDELPQFFNVLKGDMINTSSLVHDL